MNNELTRAFEVADQITAACGGAPAALSDDLGGLAALFTDNDRVALLAFGIIAERARHEEETA